MICSLHVKCGLLLLWLNVWPMLALAAPPNDTAAISASELAQPPAPAAPGRHALPGSRSALLPIPVGSGASPKGERGDLYVLAIGVSSYRARELQLLYPAKDARDFADLLQAQQHGLYREVSARVLTDQSATKDNILDGLEWLQKQPTAHDVAVLFLAGHGITDPTTSDYYFLPVDANPKAVKRTMLAQTEFQNTLRRTAGKVLLFLDTCHAGRVFGTARTRGSSAVDDFIAELKSAPNGIVVFTSSTGYQLSLEAKEWGNGAFTRALLEGLRGRADVTHSGRVTVNMLDLYISQRVKSLTDARQTPSTAKLSTISDFPIVIVQRLTNEDVPVVH